MAKPRLVERFSLMNRDYRVRFATDREEKAMTPEDADGEYGVCNYENAEIILRRRQNRENLAHTYFHEFAHALFMAVGRPDLSDDEKLVDAVGGALHQYEKTMTGRLTMRERKDDEHRKPRNGSKRTRSRVR